MLVAQEQKFDLAPFNRSQFRSDSLTMQKQSYHIMGIKNNHTLDYKIDLGAYKTYYNRLKNTSYARFIIPTGLIAYGALAKYNNSLKEMDQEIHEEIDLNISKGIHIDDYLRYVPSVAVYGLHLMGVESKNNYRDQTFIMLTSHIITDFTVGKMKKLTDIRRPDGGTGSFPSSHSSFAFVGAHIMFKEYHETSTWIGFAGYLTAATTGAMRLINQKHWLSDVLTGAGVAILSVEISYLLLPVFHRAIGVKKTGNFAVAPMIGDDIYGVGLAYTFQFLYHKKL